MKKVETNEESIIIEDVNKQFIRKYKKNKQPLYEYQKFIPINITADILSNSKVYAPKTIKNTSRYIDLEYIQGTKIDENVNHKTLIETIINYMVYLNKLDCQKLSKYTHWNNNTEYFNFLINNLSKIKKTFSHNTKIIIELLNIGNDELEKLKKISLDNLRKMSLINRNISFENMLLKFNRIYILDWKYAAYADLAHELAIHFIFMDYAKEDKDYILTIISKKLNIDINRLKKDIKVYITYETLRKLYLETNNITIKRKKEETYNLELLYAYYKYYAKLTGISILPKDEIEKIFKEIK